MHEAGRRSPGRSRARTMTRARAARARAARPGHQPRHPPHPQIGRAHVLNSSHVEISYAVFCLKKKIGAVGAAVSGFVAGDVSCDVVIFVAFGLAAAALWRNFWGRATAFVIGWYCYEEYR